MHTCKQESILIMTSHLLHKYVRCGRQCAQPGRGDPCGPRGPARAVGLAQAAAPSRAPRTQDINRAMNASKSLLSDNSRRFCRVNANCGGSKSRLVSKKSKKCSEKAICSRNGSIGIQGHGTGSRSKATRRQGEGQRPGCSHRASVAATGGRHRQAAGCRTHGPGGACLAPRGLW